MLAEIFLLRLEAAARVAKEAEAATSARFVPITLLAPSGGLSTSGLANSLQPAGNELSR
jgi:hypothetical protein